MENKNPKNENQKKKRSKAAKIVLLSILGCIGVMVLIILIKLIIGMAGGTGTQDGSILGNGFSTLFTILGFLVLALVLAWLLTEPSFKKEEEVIIADDRYASYVKKAKTPRPLADKTGAKAAEQGDKAADKTEAPADEDKKPSDKAEAPADEDEKPSDKTEAPADEDEKTSDAEDKVEEKSEEKPVEPETAKKKVNPTTESANDADAKTDAEGAAAAVAAGTAAVGTAAETVFVRYRRSYMSRLIQSDDDLKAYYTDIKNKLLSYKDVRDRVSWDFESFNTGRKKLAKINVKGKTLTVNLALDPAKVDAKYYATDVSDKAKLSEVPTLMKVKSGRSAKYTLELIEKMMIEEDIPAKSIPSNESFDLEYRDNDALVKDGYIKAMYDKDIDPDGNYIEQEIDIEDFLKK